MDVLDHKLVILFERRIRYLHCFGKLLVCDHSIALVIHPPEGSPELVDIALR